MRAPQHLSEEARRLWKGVMAEYAIEDTAGQLLLQTATEAHDRIREARRIITEQGVTVRDRYGHDKPHPMLAVEKDARAAMLLALKHLDLDVSVQPKSRLGRPPGGRGLP